MIKQSKDAAHWWLLQLCCTLMLLTACSENLAQRGTEAQEDALQISLSPAPGGLQGTTVDVQLRDAAGQPVTDATVTLEGNMNHAGMVPVIAEPVTDASDGTSDGHYRVPFQFSMLGDWILSVTVEQADGTTIYRDIEATVGEDEVQINDGHSSADQPMEHGQMTGGDSSLHVAQAWMRPAPIAGGTGAVYLTVTNHTDMDDLLQRVTTTAATTAELHETINDNNVMRMEPRPEGLPLPAGETLVLEPGGKHIMLVELAQALQVGDTVMVTLHFAHAEAIMLEITVGEEPAAGSSDDSINSQPMEHDQH